MVVTLALSLGYCLYYAVARRRLISLVIQAILLVGTVVVIAWAHRNIPPRPEQPTCKIALGPKKAGR